MLIDCQHGHEIKQVPFRSKFELWKSQLDPNQIAAIKSEIHELLDHGPIHTTSWIPGKDWWGTPYFPIWDRATRQNDEEAAKCFGLFVCNCVLERPERWGYGHYEKDGVPIKGRTYFRLDQRR